ncbi:glycosyltransferase [Tenacibaculum sp. SG-28]|uniref:glycosyltransferase n=1 Tax=Tenacibaculum sp. SG-28 TaxID=754426 RepID=UPI000CF42307|nr:glycosyltransferase [Tenacibaculum sp. SG-28]PQJ23135.1 hypothetical protein BSU00_02535 [Tenacibaculum sp. SG-28]
MKVGIIIPCYNEEGQMNINSFRRCLLSCADVHFCFVNNGSKDRTLDVLHTFKSEFEDRVAVINMKKTQSKSLVIRVGARYYYSIPSIKYVGYLDEDLSNDFENFDAMFKKVKQNRKIAMIFGDINREGRNLFQKLVSLWFFFLNSSNKPIAPL